MTTGQHPSRKSAEKIRGWLTGRLPEDWFTEPVDVTVDRDEITIIGRIPEPTVSDDASDAERASASAGKVKEFR